MNQSSSWVLNEEIDVDGDGDASDDDGGDIHGDGDDGDDGVCAFENDPSPTVERIVESELGQSGFRGPSLLSRNSQQIANSEREILTSLGEIHKITNTLYRRLEIYQGYKGCRNRSQASTNNSPKQSRKSRINTIFLNLSL